MIRTSTRLLFSADPILVFGRTMTNQKVFVYGTLKTNEPNHHVLTKPENGYSRLLGLGSTKTKYPLIIGTKYNIPFLLYSPGNGHHVRGEVYEVDDKMLCNLDILEDHPNYYIREIDDIVMIDRRSVRDSGLIRCWVYFIKTFNPSLLNKPALEDYSSKGSHGLEYMERSKRDPNYNHRKELDNNESTLEDLDDLSKK